MPKRHSVSIILCARYRWPFILTSENKLEMFSKTLCKTLYLRSNVEYCYQIFFSSNIMFIWPYT